MSEEIPVFTQSAEPMAVLKVHPWRSDLYEELHNRPSPIINGPCQVTHFTLLLEQNASIQEYVVDLCKRFSVPVPNTDASCFYQDFGAFELRWERHLEFANFTFIFPETNPFASDTLSYIPKDWLAAMPGELVVALNLVLIDEEPSKEQLRWFEGQRVSGSYIAAEKAKVWTAFKLHSDGFGRMLVCNKSLTPYQTGRLVQRLFELETYRLMSLLALPIARQTGHELRATEESLTQLHDRISDIEATHDERELLQQLSLLAADVERRRSNTNYRFSAAVAYHDLVNDRLNQLRETPIDGMQSLREFLERRLTPGIKTCNSVRDRLEDLSKRITRTTSLLRARVDLTIQEQNQDLLSSMNHRSQLQLRLQQTVEGLSVVAISYYLVSLLGFVYQGMNSLGLNFNENIAKGVSAPIVVGLVYFAVRRIRAQITKAAKKKP